MLNRLNDIRDELAEELEEDDFINLLENCKDIAFCEWSSSGYSQGDHVRGYAYCGRERFKKMADANTENRKNRAIELFESEVRNIGMWMWGVRPRKETPVCKIVRRR